MLPIQARDPIPQFRKYILEEGLLSESQIRDIEKEVLEVVEDAVKFADESPKPVRCAVLACCKFVAGHHCGNLW